MVGRRNFLQSWHAVAYKGHPRVNPFFHKKDISPHPVKNALVASGILLFLVGGFVAATYIPVFGFSGNTIEGLTTIPESDIVSIVSAQESQHRFFVFPQSNQWFLNTKELAQKLNAAYHFSSLTVIKEKGRVHIVVKEEVSLLAWRNGNVFSIIDKNGVVIRTSDDNESAALKAREEGSQLPDAPQTGLQPTMPIIEGDRAPAVGDTVLDAARITAILAVNDGLIASGIHPRSYVFERVSDPWARVRTDQNYDILVDFTKDIKEALANIAIIRADRNTNLEGISYIDVRFGDHVYVK